MKDQSKVFLFLDDEQKPISEYKTHVNFELDTTKLVGCQHTFKIIGEGNSGKEGIRKILFIVSNGPFIAVQGINENSVVDGVLPLMINAYNKGDRTRFLIEGSELTCSIPSWPWVFTIGFVGWVIYYFITFLNMHL